MPNIMGIEIPMNGGKTHHVFTMVHMILPRKICRITSHYLVITIPIYQWMSIFCFRFDYVQLPVGLPALFSLAYMQLPCVSNCDSLMEVITPNLRSQTAALRSSQREVLGGKYQQFQSFLKKKWNINGMWMKHQWNRKGGCGGPNLRSVPLSED